MSVQLQKATQENYQRAVMVIFPLAPDQTIAQMWSNGARGGDMVMWPTTSRDPKRSRSWPQNIWGSISRNPCEIEGWLQCTRELHGDNFCPGPYPIPVVFVPVPPYTRYTCKESQSLSQAYFKSPLWIQTHNTHRETQYEKKHQQS